jgi:hypothetical protein
MKKLQDELLVLLKRLMKLGETIRRTEMHPRLAELRIKQVRRAMALIRKEVEAIERRL